jgi:hypothetical protein
MTPEAIGIIERIFKAMIFVPIMGLADLEKVIALAPDARYDKNYLRDAREWQGSVKAREK